MLSVGPGTYIGRISSFFLVFVNLQFLHDQINQALRISVATVQFYRGSGSLKPRLLWAKLLPREPWRGPALGVSGLGFIRFRGEHI